MTHTVALPKAKEQVLPQAENLFKIILFLTLLFGFFYITQQLVDWIDSLSAAPAILWAAKLAVVVFFATVNCFLLVGMGVLAHEAVHKVLFKRVLWNDLAGGMLWGMGLVPFYANRQFHLTHHQHAHQRELDTENPMHNYPFWFAFFVGSVIGLMLQYRIFFRNLFLHPFDKAHRGRLLKDIFFIGSSVTIYLLLVPALGISVIYTVIPTLLVLPLVFGLRAMSDHYSIPEVPRRTKKVVDVLEEPSPFNKAEPSPFKKNVTGWVVETNSFLEWIWSHVNYHEVHHKYPYLSHKYMKQAFLATRDQDPYMVAKGYLGSLKNMQHRSYYGDPEDMRRFLYSA